MGDVVSSSLRAIVEDAQFSLAHSGLADAYSLLGHYGVLGPADVWGRAAASAAAAVSSTAVSILPVAYSQCKAAMGSTLAARRAGR